MAYAHRKNYPGEAGVSAVKVSRADLAREQKRYGGEPSRQEDWNALRDELENLLEQVSAQHGQPPRHLASGTPLHRPSQLREPVPRQENRQQENQQQRRQDALRSVQRAVDRFNEPDEGLPMPAHSPNNLQSAIEQIRARQSRAGQPRARSRQYAPANPERQTRERQDRERQDRARHDGAQSGINQALSGLNQRFARVEQALGEQQKSGQAIEDMATQIEQLASVVELLAGSVGESGHIKRLENQIAKLANAVQSEPDLDYATISQRLDILSDAFERLTQLQTRQVDHLEEASGGQNMQAIEDGVRNIYERLDTMDKTQGELAPVDLTSIEACVRSIYDRMDALETGLSASTPALEQLSADMAEFTRAMHSENGLNPSASLVGRVDALNQRIAQIEEGGEQVGDLRLDIQNLHNSVVDAMEPRFSALENQIGALSASPHGAAGEGEISVESLEAQIRALGEKMDRTGNELSDLQKVYGEANGPESAPDFSVIADMVAQRTSEAISKTTAQNGSGVGQNALDKLEKRLSSLFENQKSVDENPVFSRVQTSIDLVNQRLARLEEMLGAQNLTGAEQENDPEDTQEEDYAHLEGKPGLNPMLSNAAMPFVSGKTDGLEDFEATSGALYNKRPPHPGLLDAGIEENPPNDFRQEDEPGEEDLRDIAQPETVSELGDRPARHLIPALQDTMPHPPATEGPLNAPPFPAPLVGKDTVPVPDALRAEPSEIMVMDNGQSDFSDLARETPDLGEPETPPANPVKLPRFKASEMVPPPAPKSSLTSGFGNSASQPATDARTNNGSGAKTAQANTKVSRSTFIEAARRAAKKNNPETPDTGSQSLIGKALARFRKKPGSENKPVSEPKPDSAPKEASASQEIPEPQQTTPIPVPASEYAGDARMDAEQVDVVEAPDSFLTRHRQPILLVATLLAVSLLTMNLINQRFNPQQASPGAPNSGAPIAASLGDRPADAPADITPATPSADIGEGGGDIVGAIGLQTPASQNTATNVPVRMINPALISEMPASLDLASVSAEQLDPSSGALALPPEGVGPLELRQAAANGDARAQFEVAAILAEGRALPQDLEAAALWYERAAGRGLAPAAYRIGNMYENGVGVAKDLEAARLWYQLGANAGNRMSMHNLASLLASGGLGDQQFEAAVQWFERAAALGLTDSQFNLGMLYARGLGVPQNLEESFRWFSIAAAGGDEDALRARDDVLRSLDGPTLSRLQGEISGWRQMKMNILANFAPIGSWSQNFDPGPAIGDENIIMRVQAALNKLGFDAGTPDGIFGPQTEEAVGAFERATGMNPSGQINPRLLSVLGSQPV